MTNNPNFSHTLPNAWRALLHSMCVLNRIQFSAHWEPRRRGC